jgi:murein DD-endopeptidase MepM/ murein hydrolase activator NlpD
MPLKLYYDLDIEDEKLLMDVRAGTIYEVVRDKNGSIEQFLLPIDDELELHIYRSEDGNYSAKVIPIIYQLTPKSLCISFDDIPSKDIVKKSENFDLALGVESVFRGIVDFKKIRKGDKLVVLYDEKRRLGRFFGEQRIKAAMIETLGKSYYQILAKDGKYYDQFGKSRQKSSFIVPCRYKRISSKFTKKRWHPILHRYRAHHGIDYATPIGTPVKAAYDGKVIFVGRKGGYGKCVVIRHPHGYKTIYAHLSRYKCKKGQRVKKGKVIALSGNTGRSTGPHLHFGLSLNGRWIDPATKIVITGGLRGVKRKEFKKRAKYYIQRVKNVLKSNELCLKDMKSLEDIEKR